MEKGDVNEALPLPGRQVLVTGGTTGFGRSIGAMLCREGWKVFVPGQDPQHLKSAPFEIQGEGGDVVGVAADLASTNGILRVFQASDEMLGPLDAVISIAGLGSNGELDSLSHEECGRVVNVNLLSVIQCSWKRFYRMKGRGGQIVMIGSRSAEIFDKAAVYTATKSGVHGFAGSLRNEVNQQGIRVSLIEPGSVGTDMVDESPKEQRALRDAMKMQQPEDVAQAVVFVLSQPKGCDVIQLQVRPHLQFI
jgi:NAD(P)-dependent dehydrogenase (short-subunit alcohol dehydrogenase family)